MTVVQITLKLHSNLSSSYADPPLQFQSEFAQQITDFLHNVSLIFSLHPVLFPFLRSSNFGSNFCESLSKDAQNYLI
jgi:hypothetical protein